MRIEIVSDVMISGEPHREGSLLDVTPDIARLLINSNKAIAVKDEPAAAPEVAPKRSRNPHHSTPEVTP